ncbi:MAG: hypothetical protein K2N65_01095 [Anaeroplasmataceae bacterium]|nr:hypothetical protein [Anaeroplasmataceae bacterium]
MQLDLIKPNSSKAKRLALHIRRNLISKHPAIIIGEDGNAYLFMPMTTNPIAKTVRLKKNPNPHPRTSDEKSYIIFRMRANKKSAFSAPLNWTLSPEDYRVIEEYARKKIK